MPKSPQRRLLILVLAIPVILFICLLSIAINKALIETGFVNTDLTWLIITISSLLVLLDLYGIFKVVKEIIS